MAKILGINELKNWVKKNDAKLRSGSVIYQGSAFGRRLITGHNAVIRENNIIGDDVIIGTNSYLGPGNKIGNNVKIHTDCFLEGVTLADMVIISPHVVFTNDPYPPCRICTEKVGGATVGKNTVIGSNATILPGIKIGANVLIGAGSVVTRNVADGLVVIGNPANVLKKRSELVHKHKAK